MPYVSRPTARAVWLPLLACTFTPLDSLDAAELLAGAATVSLTPDRPVALSGQMRTRISTAVASPVTATVLVLESRDGDRVLGTTTFVSCDVVSIPDDALAAIRAQVAQKTPGVPVERIVPTEPAIGDEQAEQRGREGLRHGRDPARGVDEERCPPREVRDAERLAEEDLTATRHEHHPAGHLPVGDAAPPDLAQGLGLLRGQGRLSRHRAKHENGGEQQTMEGAG